MTINRNYELMFILNPKLSKEEISNELDKIEKSVVGKGQKIVKKDDWGIRELSYEIKKEKKGYYIIYYVETNSEGIDAVNHLVRITKNILRAMIIKHEEWPTEKSSTKVK